MPFRVRRLIRRAVPSLAALSYNRAFALVANTASAVTGAMIPEFRNLPPNALRIRIGSHGRILANQARFLVAGKNYVMHWLAQGYFKADSNVLEIGCGCGRIAQHFRNWWFKGHYTGIDIDVEMLAYCRRAFPAPKFRFADSPHANVAYGRPTGGAAADFQIAPAASQDFVFATSLLTHLLEPELQFYLHETARVLKPGGCAFLTFFSAEMSSDGERWTFRHRIGNAYVESLRVPEAAVAYEEAFISRLAQKAFGEVSIVREPPKGQLALVLRKPIPPATGDGRSSDG